MEAGRDARRGDRAVLDGDEADDGGGADEAFSRARGRGRRGPPSEDRPTGEWVGGSLYEM